MNLTKNHYTKVSSMLLCFPITIRKKINVTQAIDGDMITVIVFADWIKEISIKRYGDNLAILPLDNVIEIYLYSEAMLKHLPEKSLETFQKELLYSNEKVILKNPATDRRENNSDTLADRSDSNLNDRITTFRNLIGTNYVYRILLRYLVDLGLVNRPIKFDTKFNFNCEANNTKLFESQVQQVPTTQPDAKLIFQKTLYIKYEQIKLNDNFRKYIEASLKLKIILRTGIMPSPYLKTYETNTGIRPYVVEFKGAFLEISLVYDKSDQHNTLYDSYNAELAATFVGSIKLENANNKYSTSNKTKFDLTNENNKYLMNRQFVAWYCKGCSVVPLTEYANSKVYQELPRLDKIYGKKESHERIYIDHWRD